MRIIPAFIAICLLPVVSGLHAQNINFSKDQLDARLVSMSIEKFQGKETLKVVADTTVKDFDQPSFVKIKNLDFKNGSIEVKLLSRLVKNAPEWARGFIGITFRIAEKNDQFEGIYLRPSNGRDEDQLRRNHAIQYFSFPGFSFEQSRKEAPGKYESYADMGLDEWITMRIEVNGNRAKLFLNNNKQPSLIVNDLKHGENSSGAIGLWVGNWTEGYFKDLKVWKK